ncbi:hypothetical protein C4D60_Mb04t17360 [Musa balbisiana]|uniref:Uncharacterized protein n=1 Tax=Musa balbisiana TaxID=52838 RepID=A0A4V4H9U0_MUSBA|nr:hypothetical protein C4D60_Mb04t17360 [Musa balbisiana]
MRGDCRRSMVALYRVSYEGVCTRRQRRRRWRRAKEPTETTRATSINGNQVGSDIKSGPRRPPKI